MNPINGSKPKRRFLALKCLAVVLLLLGLFGASFGYYLYNEVKDRFASRRWSIPARVFSSTAMVYAGQRLTAGELRQILEARRYKEASKEPLRAGEYRQSGSSLAVFVREFRFPGHWSPSGLVQFDFKRDRVAKIRSAQGEITFLELEPLEIARLFGPARESRMLVNIAQVPSYLTGAVVAIEDHRFFEHGGVDYFGIARALFADVRAGHAVQGGSTITQQLMKNYFLDSEKSFKRKLLELSMAIIIETLYGKEEILEMYMNEIYMGQRGGIAIHGVGEAARYYFGRNVEDLTLAESATLAGMIRTPNSSSPVARPDLAIERRNVVLKRMLELGKISQDEYHDAAQEPLKVAGASAPANVAPYFIDYVRRQLYELYSSEALASQGLSIYTTLHPEMALAADSAVKEGLAEIEAEHGIPESAPKEDHLQGVLIALQPKTGSIFALVGGRDYGASSFNRALHSHRQPGSAIKPFVMLSALDRFGLSDWVQDEQTTYTVEGVPWTPKNYDNRYRGRVSVREALEQSLNAATVSIALEAGLENAVAVMRSVGIVSPLQPVPSLALGAFEVTPIELAGAFATLDNDGQKPFLLSLKEIVAEDGDVLERRTADIASVTTPAKAFLVTNLMQGVVERGTAKGLKKMGIDFPCAGKTGTSNDLRDSWFAGYTTDLLVLTWVGFDDNRPTGLTGAQGAARVWARFMNNVRPWMNPQGFRVPPGVVQKLVCGESALLATYRCRTQRLEFFLAEKPPKDYCTQHGRN
jgi:penicillin-binding protein 1B